MNDVCVCLVKDTKIPIKHIVPKANNSTFHVARWCVQFTVESVHVRAAIIFFTLNGQRQSRQMRVCLSFMAKETRCITRVS